jgi:hypothetical protein
MPLSASTPSTSSPAWAASSSIRHRNGSSSITAFRVSDASPALRYVAEEAGFQALWADE